MTISVLLLLLASNAQAAFSPHSGLDFTLSAQRIADICQKAKEHALSDLGAVATMPQSAQTFTNTAEALDNALWDLNDRTASTIFPKYVSISSSARDAANDCETMIKQFGVETFTRQDLFAALTRYKEKKEPLSGERKKLLEKELLDFKRSGLGLPPRKRNEVKKLRLRLAGLESRFGKNLGEVKDTLLLTKEELEGLPDDFIRRLAQENGRYRVSLDYPDYYPFMNNAKNPDARRRLESLFNNRAATDNLPLLVEALDLRLKAARLLGYDSHADFVLEERMAKNLKEVEKFLRRLDSKLKILAKKELAVLLELKKWEEGTRSDGILHAWDWRYYDNLLKKTRYSVDDEKIKEYFPADVVTEGMLGVYQQLLGVKFHAVEKPALWHPDVRLYEITDAASGSAPSSPPTAFEKALPSGTGAANGPVIGYFYMDLYPREGKYKHAAAFNIIQARRLPDGSYQTPVSAIVANFNKPTPDRPSLLKHSEVETFFHEFGHIMHQTLTKARFGRFSGSNVAQDFVEAPSQMLENWVWDARVLPLLSGHYQDHAKKLPPELLEKMLAAKNVDSGLIHLRQAFFASIDMRYHGPEVFPDTTAEYRSLMGEISLIPMSPGAHPEASFGHIMDGYDAGYYGYLWSKVFAQDMFSRFEAEGVLNPAIGQFYRQTILERGSSASEAEILRAFLGREPNEEAFLKSLGLVPK